MARISMRVGGPSISSFLAEDVSTTTLESSGFGLFAPSAPARVLWYLRCFPTRGSLYPLVLVPTLLTGFVLDRGEVSGLGTYVAPARVLWYLRCSLDLFWTSQSEALVLRLFAPLTPARVLWYLPLLHSDSAAPWLRLHVALLKIENLFVLA
ncbi:hypothetical protein U1Q18_015941 [Sarracenia purpurea var. burkii]